MKKKTNKEKLLKEKLKRKEIRDLKRQKKQSEQDWKMAVKERDNFTCQICNQYLKDNPKNCHAHHILDKKNYPKLKYTINNGITLCYRDHKIGKFAPHMNAIWFENFLKNNRYDLYLAAINNLKNYDSL